MADVTKLFSDVSLDDKYDLTKDRVFITGTQAIIRLLLMQRERDRRAGLNTAGFVSGYRGSPLGALDQQLFRVKKQLDAANIVFQPGLNEELAATAVWGSQQAEMRGEGRYDGVFGLWYGKGPGVDRSGDVFRHANMAGTSPHGGVLALMGDDHTAESSTTAHQSEFHFVDVMMPILNPAGVQEVLDFGLYGYAMSRFASTWVAFKGVKDTVESTAVIDGSLERVQPVIPEDFVMPPGGLSIRPRDGILAMEARLQDYKRDAMLAFIRANPINRIVTSGGAHPRLGVITVGKSYLDVRQALDDLGIDEVRANDLGLRLYKIGCPWPLEPEGLKAFVRGLDLVIVVEEKRSLIEVQLREELYGTANQPVCVGKKDETGQWLFPVKGALDPNDIAIAIGERLLRYHASEELRARVAHLKTSQQVLAATEDVASRVPHFCSGCPHNSSTKVPEGMRAYAGIGCHYMVQWMDRSTDGFTQMGGEGANWIGEAPFSKRGHVFQNLGDGTYNHSGVLAVRFAIASGVNMTYKVLFNDAVAMTGGQHHEGNLTVDQIARQLAAEGIKRLALVSDEPDKYPSGTDWPAGLTFHHRSELDQVQREIAEVEGVTAIIYDQTCAAEKRRRRKRGQFPDPDKRVIINELVCEGCGDCGVKSNCVSIQPVETEFGRKRMIDQSNCNKDFSCIEGFCPSFVTVHGAKPKKASAVSVATDSFPALPEPELPEIKRTFDIIVTGVGGTGVVTIGAILGMAAHLENKGCGMIDMAGLAQKGGAVYSHVKLANRPEDIHAIRVAAGEADLILGCDLIVSGTKKVLAGVKKDETFFIANTAEVMPGEFTRNADFSLPAERIKRAILAATGQKGVLFVNATGLATALMGNAIAANMFILGLAFQRGRVPLSSAAIERAIELNGEAVAMNKAAFQWGRRAALDLPSVEALFAPTLTPTRARSLSQTLDERITRRIEVLTRYQNAAYADRYAALVARIRAAETKVAPGSEQLTDAVARHAFKLMAIKDEYEVARLYTDGSFMRQVQSQFEGDLRFEFHLAPPILARTDAQGRPKKSSFGPWMMSAFKLLAALKGLRCTPFDIFGYSAERRMERRLIADYEAVIAEILERLAPHTLALATEIASIPEKIRGYGHVKERHLAAARAEEAALLERLRAGGPTAVLAAE
jgi:indolepyruvate ferredoxin oxidoreductase